MNNREVNQLKYLQEALADLPNGAVVEKTERGFRVREDVAPLRNENVTKARDLLHKMVDRESDCPNCVYLQSLAHVVVWLLEPEKK